MQSLQGHKGLQIMIVFIFSFKSVSENSSWHIYIGKIKHMQHNIKVRTIKERCKNKQTCKHAKEIRNEEAFEYFLTHLKLQVAGAGHPVVKAQNQDTGDQSGNHKRR